MLKIKNYQLLIIFILITAIDKINSTFKAIVFILIILIVIVINSRIFDKIIAILWHKNSEKKLHIKYGVYKAFINEQEFKEEKEDFNLNVQLADVKELVENKNSFYIYTNEIMLAFSKKQFIKEDIYDYVLNVFKNELNKREKQ